MLKKGLFLALLIVWLSGCAFTQEKIDLSYNPQLGISEIANAKNVIVSVKINDVRQDKSNKVSSKKNGYGVELAPIIVNEDVTLIIKQAIEQELKIRGFSVGNKAFVEIVADLTRFWNDFKSGFFVGNAVADLNMTILVKSNNEGILYTRQIVAQGIEPNIQLANGDNARLALNRALGNGIKILFEDQVFINSLLKASKVSSIK